jgi:integrase
MSQQLCEVLQARLTLQEAEGILSGQPLGAGAWLFPGSEGMPMTRASFYHAWERVLRLGGVRARKPHTLRHTYASILLQNGEPLPYVRDQLGHHSISLTVDTYGHLLPGANKAAVDRLDGATNRNLPATSPARVGRAAAGTYS